MIWQRRSVGNWPQVREFQHQQLHPTALEVYPGLGAVAAPLSPAHYAAAEGLMDDVGADCEVVGVTRVAVFGDLARAVVDVGAAAGRAEHRSRLLGRDTRDQSRIDLAQEARGPRLVALAVKLARQRVGQIQEPPRARHPDVAQPALL